MATAVVDAGTSSSSLEVVTTLFVVEILFFLDDTRFVGCTHFAVVT